MPYTLPQVLVFQEFTLLPTAITDPLRAHIAGGNAELLRYSVDTEKAKIKLGVYDPLSTTNYAYPSRPTGGVVDQSYFKLYADDVLLKYHEDGTSGGYGTCIPVSGAQYKNWLQSSAVNYKNNVVIKNGTTTTYARHSSLKDRDVKIGDTVDVSGTASTGALSVRTTIKDIRGTVVPAVIGTSTADAGNVGSTSASATITKTAGASNCIAAAANGSAYVGAVDGDISETYTVTVTQASTGMDHTTARLRVRSASGRDDKDNVTPSAVGVATAIGTRGLTVTFSEDEGPYGCSLSATAADVSQDDFVVGQEWSVAVQQDWTPVTHAKGSTYTGTADTTYIVKVTKGGTIASTNSPQISVTTTTGVDVSGPTDVTTSASAVTVGTYGLTITFTGTALAKDDIYYMTVTSQYEGNQNILVLNNNIPQKLIDEGIDCNVKLYIAKSDVEIARKRAGSPGVYNYVLGDPGLLDTGFDVNAGITLYDSSWTDSSVEQPLDITEATIYSEYRAFVATKANSVFTISDVSSLDDIPGQLHPDNELKWGLFKALENANGTEVKYTAVANPVDNASWIDCLELLVGRDDVYGLVPLTRNSTVLGLWAAHVDAQSSPENGRWRSMWLSLAADSTEVIVDKTKTSDSEEALAIVEDDPDIAGNQFVLVTVEAGNAKFITNDVQPGDLMRFDYTTDGWNDTVYTEYVIDMVISEDTIRLKTGQSTVAVATAKKLEVWRNLNATELAAQLAKKADVYSNRRIKAVWPDTVGTGGVTYEGYHLCAALAGLRSGVVPQQGLTNVEIAGFDDLTRTVDLFNQTQLNTMAEEGIWIVTQVNPVTTRHALTTAGFGDVLTQEEQVTSNVDSMSYLFLRRTEDLIGKTNVTPGTINIIRGRLAETIEFFKKVRVPRLGGQLNDGKIVELRQHTLLKDRIVANLQLTVPVPLNNLEIHLQIVA